MNRQVKTVLGIDVSFSRINLALLRNDRDGLKLLKAVGCPVPEGTIKNGNIEDVTALAGAIKQLKVRNKIHANRTVLSMVINPVIMQILDIPNNAWDNVGQFVRNEIKQYATLSMTKIASDYCGLKSPGKTDCRRAFVVAADGQKIAAFVEALDKEGLKIDAIEPFSMAYTRACYSNKIAESSDRNLLLVVLRDGILTLYVFKNQTLDFVENVEYEAGRLNFEQCLMWIIEKTNAVLKFYKLKLGDKCDKWKVNFIIGTDNEFTEEKIESLAARLKNGQLSHNFYQSVSPADVEIKSLEETYSDTSVAGVQSGGKLSAIAVGLAMKLLNRPNFGLDINLLLPGMVEAKPERRHTLIIANIAAAILLLAILSVGFFNIRFKGIKENMQQKYGGRLSVDNIQTLFGEQASLDGQITDTTENIENMNTILNTRFFARWDRILDEIRYATPEPVRIINIFSNDGLRIILKGHAFSYESVHLFVRMLNESEYMKSVSLIGTEKDSDSSGLVMYSINCSLTE